MTEAVIKITPVVSASERKQFIGFPYKLNKPDKNWVAPLLLSQKELLSPKHIFWKTNPYQFFLAWKENRLVGRMAAFINKEHNAYHQSNQACFGFLEAENDAEIFRSLLDAGENFAKKYNCNSIIGPLNPSLHYELGVLVKGFESPPYFMLTYNGPYYEEAIKSAGFNCLKDFYSFKLNGSGYVPTEKMNRVSDYLKQRYNIKIRQGEMSSFKKELEIFYEIYNDAFVGHWGFTPINKDEFMLLAKDLKFIIDPRMILVAECNGEPVGFLLCLPNLNEALAKLKNGRLFPFGLFKLIFGKKKIRSARVITIAVKKSHERLGMGALLCPELMKRGLAFNYTESELSWVADDNTMMISLAKELKAIPYKTYRLYSKNIY